ncbi:MAG: NfeD family protein [Crocinitomicaceae bacterium]|jgi:membrane-bound ClpP family serine protease|nr:NfeD family protein [Crocinitomicaceae bacterium]
MENLEPLLRTYWYIAIPASVIFIIQTIMTFVGGDASDGLEADFDGDMDGQSGPSQIFSLRNLINFLLGFSWTGISFYNEISNRWVLMTVATVVGLIFLFAFFFIIKQIKKLAEDNSFRFDATIGKNAEVYLTIPAKKGGKGKVLLSLNGSTRELSAITEGEEIPTGKLVKITGLENELLIVEQL